MEELERTKGFTPKELAEYPILPEAGRHVWNWYNDMARTRQIGMGVNPISYQEIQAWSTLTGRRLRGWELETILAIDGAFRTGVDHGR